MQSVNLKSSDCAWCREQTDRSVLATRPTPAGHWQPPGGSEWQASSTTPGPAPGLGRSPAVRRSRFGACPIPRASGTHPTPLSHGRPEGGTTRHCGIPYLAGHGAGAARRPLHLPGHDS